MFAKKNLVAAAALMAIVGVAQADVKVYGTLDIGFGSLEDAHSKTDLTDPGRRKTAVNSGNMMTSYIGFAGDEDLGGGLKAEFALESFLNVDTGSNAPNLAGGFWGRGSWVGLSGNFGRVALGQYDNPLFTSGYTYNPFGSSMVVSPTMRHLYSKDASLGFDTGWVNSVTYESPVVQGFSAIAQFAPKESSASGTNNSYAAAGAYNNGPISAMLTYVKAGNTSTAGSPSNLAGTKTAYSEDQKVWNLGVSYDFGVAKAFGQYTDLKTSAAYSYDAVNAPNTPAKIVGGLGLRNKIWQLGVSAPISDKLAVMASFGSNKTTDASTKTTDRVFSLGTDYTLSKRTDVYLAFVSNTRTNLSSGQTVIGGIKHNF